ncbi:hypothetical protein [Kibdelosporangium phytohabitans]|uniref:hypothetical protein n=1 Tax=Kibdelosporangium phytohabitans TaxID=860235 RepID=UPI0012F84FF5|nr:hypothetical protein [Kibdelosporangium phytohabitans]MBE1471583.1 hypothetical protein [Kibdelosporangium phytohabitans]
MRAAAAVPGIEVDATPRLLIRFADGHRVEPIARGRYRLHAYAACRAHHPRHRR